MVTGASQAFVHPRRFERIAAISPRLICYSSFGRLRQRMVLVHKLLQALVQDMSVYLRGGDVGMTEQRLHDAEVGAAGEKVCSEGVAQHMRRQLFGIEAGARGDDLEIAGESLAREMAAGAVGGEEP